MSRLQSPPHNFAFARVRSAIVVALVAGFAPCLLAAGATSAAASTLSPFDASWCSAGGAALVGWTGTSPNLPICGPGPYYGGSSEWINIPGPYGGSAVYYNATSGFQCVELAERYLALVAGLAPVKANGGTMVENYHAAYPSTSVIVNGSPSAVGHPPSAGNVISFSLSSDFADGGDGHVAIVVGSHVDASGDGQVEIAQENVAPSDYLRTLELVDWRLSDPAEPGNAEYQYPAAEWLVLPSSQDSGGSGSSPALTTSTPAVDPAITPLVRGALDLRAPVRDASRHKAARAKKTKRS